MMRKLPTVVAVACVFSLAGTLRAADSPTGAQTQPGVIEGAQTDTAASAGQWRFFCNAHDATVKAANADAIWFSAGGNLWRYNIRTRSIDATTSPLTHPNLDGPSLHLALADDGRMIASVRNATYLWVPKSGWARLPQPAGMENSGFPAFDKASTPWFVASGFSDGSMVCPWDNGVWGEWIKVNKQIHGLCPLGDGWLTWTYPDSSAKSTAFTWFDAKFQTRRELANDVPPSSFTGQCYHAGGKVLGLFLATPQGGSRDDQVGLPSVLRLITDGSPDKFEEKLRSPHVGVDLASLETFRVDADEAKKTMSIVDGAGKAVAQLPLPEDYRAREWLVMLRDANGDYWHGARRLTGKTWQPLLPPNMYYYPHDVRTGLASGRLRYDETNATWVDAWPQIPGNVHAYNPPKRTGWLEKESKGAGPRPWEQCEFAADGTKKVLQTVSIPQERFRRPGPSFQDPAGDWWFGSRYRWDGKSLDSWDDGGFSGAVNSKTGLPVLVLSPKGDVWMYHASRVWKRFDRQADRFADTQPYDDFAFDFAGQKLAVCGEPQPFGWGDGSYFGPIYTQADGDWAPLANPFIGDRKRFAGDTFGWAPPLSGERSRRDGHMLVTCAMGVLDWDGQRNRWAYLTPFGGDLAIFDDHGRRVLVATDVTNRILMFEGDPFRAATAPHAATRPDQLDVLPELVAGLDNPSWQKRQHATAELINLIRKQPEDVGSFLKRQLKKPDLPPEARIRIGMVMEELQTLPPPGVRPPPVEIPILWRRKVGNSLFERMSRPLVATFPDGCVVKPGMRFDTAKSIFHACGLVHTGIYNNPNSPDQSYQAFLLPDRTMVYLRVTGKDGTGAVVSLGMGQTGQGNDPAWPWQDESRNNLSRLELEPAAFTTGP